MGPAQQALVRGDGGRLTGAEVVALVGAGASEELARFAAAYYEAMGTLHLACRAVGLPYREARARRVEDPAWKAVLGAVDDVLVETLHHAYWGRAMDPAQKQPAYQIFALKSRDVRYSERPVTPVAVQVNVTDGGRGGALVSVPAVAASIPAGRTES